MQYIGMDTHISNLDFAVVNEAGWLAKASAVAISVSSFVEFLKTVSISRTNYLGKGTTSFHGV